MKLRRILPLAAAALLGAGCRAGDVTHPLLDIEVSGQKGLMMGGSGGYTAPAAPRLDGSQMGGSGGFTGAPGDSLKARRSAAPPADSTTAVGRGSQMGGSGG